MAVCLSGCGSGDATQISPTSTTPADANRPLTLLVPADTEALFTGLMTLAQSAGMPYDVAILEVVLVDSGVQAIIDGIGDVMFGTRRHWSNETLSFYEIFRTPTAIFVNSELGPIDITRGQAARIFAGEVVSWLEIDGPDLEIHVFVQQEGDSNTIAMRQYLLGDRPFAESSQVIVNDKQLISVVGGLPGAVGFTGWASMQFYESSAPSTSYPSMARINGTTPEDIDYPLMSSMGLLFRADRREYVEPLLHWVRDFLQSEFGQLLIDQYGFSSFYSGPIASGIDNNANRD